MEGRKEGRKDRQTDVFLHSKSESNKLPDTKIIPPLLLLLANTDAFLFLSSFLFLFSFLSLSSYFVSFLLFLLFLFILFLFIYFSSLMLFSFLLFLFPFLVFLTSYFFFLFLFFALHSTLFPTCRFCDKVLL